MKNITLNLLLTLLFTLVLAVSQALPESKTDSFYYNPLLLNGKTMNIETFSVVSKGILSMITQNPKTAPNENIPFLIYLMRTGKVVDGKAYAYNHPVMSVEISKILKSAKVGDHLVIESAPGATKFNRKVLVVKSAQPMPRFDWFYSLINKDRC